MTTLIDNARIVLADCVRDGAVLIEEDKIAAILPTGAAVPEAVQRIDAQGDVLMPGCIDLHGDDIEFEIGALGPRAGAQRMPVEVGLLQSDKNAVAWGITTKVHALAYFEDESKNRSKRLSGAIMDKILAYQTAGHLLAEHWVDLRYEVTAAPDYTIEAMAHPIVRMISIMDHTPGEGQFANIEAYKALNRQITDASDEDLDRLVAEKIARSGLKQAHQSQVAEQALKLGRVIASHDDLSAAKVDEMHALGARVAEMPVRLEAARRARELGWSISMAGPNLLRGGSASGNLSAAEAFAAGVVGCLCTDYHLPSLVCGAFKLVEEGLADLPRAIALVSSGPAAALGLGDRGSIAEGLRADLALVSQRLGHPVVRRTYRAGRCIYSDHRFDAE